MNDDPLAGVAALDGVGAATAHARDAADALLRHPAMRRQAARVAAASSVRGAQASAALAGAADDDLEDPRLQGALRATGAVPELARLWSRAPRQVLARLHTLVARDLVDDDEMLGRPRSDVHTARLGQLVELATRGSSAPAMVLAAVVHGELLALRPFGGGVADAGDTSIGIVDGLVARAAERIVLVATGVDTKAVTVPEVGHAALARAYEPLLAAYASGEPAGVAAWVRHCAEAYARGAEEGLAIAASVE